MNEERNESINSEPVFVSSVSTLKRVLALICVAAIIVIGVILVPVFFGSKQAEINEETKASNASYAAAAELNVKTLIAGISQEEYEGLYTDSRELFKDVDVNFKVPYTTDNKQAVFCFGFSDGKGISLSVDNGVIDIFGERSTSHTYPPREMDNEPTSVIAAWCPEGADSCKMTVEVEGKKFVLEIKDTENAEFDVSVSVKK